MWKGEANASPFFLGASSTQGVDEHMHTLRITDHAIAAVIGASAHRKQRARDATHSTPVDCWLRFIFNAMKHAGTNSYE